MHVSSERGYEDATIAEMISHAGVSRPTFYEYFAGKEDGLVAALQEIQRRVLATVTSSIAARAPQDAGPALIVSLIAFAQEHPAQARVLVNEAMAAGPRALDARDRSIDELSQLIDHAQRQLRAEELVPALPSQILVGATYRLLASRLRRGGRELLALQEDLCGWAASYRCRAGQRRWHTLTPVPPQARSPFLGPAPLRAPQPLARGRPKRSAPSVAENRRLRIIFATIEIMQRDGYAAANVTAICRAAGVEHHVFYTLFADKQDAVMAVHEFAFQNVMAVTSSAFFTAEQWPQRIWEAGRALTQYLDQNPPLAHVSVVESHVGGSRNVQRVEDLLVGFTIFLQEGYQYPSPDDVEPPSDVALQATAQTNYEIIYRQARSASPAIAGLLGNLAYISLTPFVGSKRAVELVDELLES